MPSPAVATSVIDIARPLVDAGLFVLLLRGKLPAVSVEQGGHGWKDATDDLEALGAVAAANPRADNVGIQPGRAGLFVLDLDETKPVEKVPALLRLQAVAAEYGGLPATLTVRTGGGGRHLYFHLPITHELGQANGITNPITGLTESGVDYRGTKGYVVAPGSTHPKTGQLYRWETPSGKYEPDLVAELPLWLIEFLAPANDGVPVAPSDWRPSTPTNMNEARVAGMVRNAVARLSMLGDGMGRRTELQRAAYSLGGLCWTFPEQQLVEAMYEAARACGHWDHDTARCIEDAVRDGAAKPRPLPPDSPEFIERMERRAREQAREARDEAESKANTEQDIPVDAYDDIAEEGAVDVAELAILQHTDLGNSYRFDVRFGEALRWCDARAQWLAWNGKRWEWDERRSAQRLAQATVERLADEATFFKHRVEDYIAKDGDEESKGATIARAMMEAAKKHAKASQSSERINAIITQAKALPHRSVAMRDLDVDPWLFCAKNGTIDLQTGVCRPHDKADLITKIAPVDYDPLAKAPRFVQFISEVFPDLKVAQLVQRALGYSLTGDVREQLWFVMKGAGSNGKSTLLETIKWVVGGYAGTLPAGMLEHQPFDRHPTELTGLHGTRFVAGAEPRKGRRWDAEKIKALTGGDSIEARFMRGDFFTITPTHKLWVSCNDLPATDDVGHGFWRRIVVVPFDVIFRRPEDEGDGPKLDAGLSKQLKGEGSGILNWMLEGLAAWNEHGLSMPDAVVTAGREYKAEQDDFARFLDDRCTVLAGLSTKSSQLYAEYRRWHLDEGLETGALSNVRFGKRLERIPGVVSIKGAHGVRKWSGIALNSADDGDTYSGDF